ncbi:MAG TPA: DUF4339 domain-containing protein [Acidisarcina sp.]
MNYKVIRGDKEFGPYSHAELVRFVAAGDVLVSDLARGDAPEAVPVPVGQIIGKVQRLEPTGPNIYPDPPNLHWGLVLLFTVLTCGLFAVVWDVVQGAWAKTVEPHSNAIYYYIGGIVLYVIIIGDIIYETSIHQNSSITGFLNIGLVILFLIGRFSLRSTLEDHFNNAEPAQLELSGVMTFFFGTYYFQYHLNDIVRRKRAGLLGPITF